MGGDLASLTDVSSDKGVTVGHAEGRCPPAGPPPFGGDDETWWRTPPRFCPHGFRRLLLARSSRLLVSVLAFDSGQREHLHQHPDSAEQFHVLAGAGALFIDDHWRALVPGQTQFRPAGVWHGVQAASRLVLLSVQAPIPRAPLTVWHPSVAGATLSSLDRERLLRFRCCSCPRCGGHARRGRLGAACTTCGSPRASVRCENCHWQVARICLARTRSQAG